jgi:hypothetical protein
VTGSLSSSFFQTQRHPRSSPKTVGKVFILNQNKPDNPNTIMQQIDKLQNIEDTSTADRLAPEIREKLKCSLFEIEDLEEE